MVSRRAHRRGSVARWTGRRLVAIGVLWGLAGGLPALGQAPVGDPFTPCEEAFAADPGSRQAVRCFRRVGSDSSRTTEAIRRLEALRREHPDNPWLPFDLAALEWARRSPRVPQLYAESAALFARRGDVWGEIDARRGRARYLTRILGRLEQAGEELERVVALAEGSGDRGLGLRARVERARWLLTAGRVEEAHRLLQADREEVLEAGGDDLEPSLRRDWIFDAARTAHELGRHRQARRLFRRWLEETPAGEAPRGEAAVRVLLAGSHLSAELPTPEARRQGRSLLRRALESARAAHNPSVELQALWLLGKVGPEDGPRGAAGEVAVGNEAVADAGRLLRRVEYLEACIERAGELGESQLGSLCRASLAAVRAGEEPRRARGLLEGALEMAAESESPWVLLHVHLEALRVAWATTRPREAAVDEVLALLERMETILLQQVEDPGVRSRLRSEWLDPRYWLSGELLGGREGAGDPRRRDLELAFGLVEEIRARALAEALEVIPRPGEASGGVTASYVSGGRALATLDRLEATLGPDEALLSFQIGYWRNMWGEPDGGGWLLVVTRGGTRVHPLPDRVALEPEVRRLRGLADPEAAPALLVSLHRRLLAPALDGLPPGVERLVLVPDGPLHRLPFALLRAEAGGPALGESHQLVRVPSATLWHHWRTSPPPAVRQIAGSTAGARGPVLVLADPELGSSPGAERGRAPDSAPVAGGAGFGGADPAPLPWARREGEAVLSALGGGRLLTGPQATEAELVEALGRRVSASAEIGPVVHLAAHAVVDDERPERSAVFLAPGHGQDGLLTPEEILGLDLDGRVVVLAACDTAFGEEVRGEGVLSLARYFFAAGARTVVASLWGLPDRGASRVMDRFYRGLARGEPVAGALREARVWAREHGVEARSRGGLVVLGDGSLVPFPGGVDAAGAGGPRAGRLRWLLAGALAGVVLLGLVMWLRRGGRTVVNPPGAG